MTSLIVANFLGAALYAVLASAGLQFVGLGNLNAESWGTMLYWAQNNEACKRDFRYGRWPPASRSRSSAAASRCSTTPLTRWRTPRCDRYEP